MQARKAEKRIELEIRRSIELKLPKYRRLYFGHVLLTMRSSVTWLSPIHDTREWHGSGRSFNASEVNPAVAMRGTKTPGKWKAAIPL